MLKWSVTGDLQAGMIVATFVEPGHIPLGRRVAMRKTTYTVVLSKEEHVPLRTLLRRGIAPARR
jgi:hypothetical protein